MNIGSWCLPVSACLEGCPVEKQASCNPLVPPGCTCVAPLIDGFNQPEPPVHSDKAGDPERIRFRSMDHSRFTSPVSTETPVIITNTQLKPKLPPVLWASSWILCAILC